ncbi:DNA alkylation repair protein, partial [Enterococcus faecalis]|uniref:DNA alkylation repair protein n=2 Tax=Enterococcus TaxID=1350 RepID=UPI0039854637
TVDGLNKVVGGLTMTYPELSQKMLAWSKAENLWLRRIAIDHQLLRKEKTDRELLETILLNNLGSDEFFINKAIGWSLRDYAKTNP